MSVAVQRFEHRLSDSAEEQVGLDVADLGTRSEVVEDHRSKVRCVTDGNMEEVVIRAGEVRDRDDVGVIERMLVELVDLLPVVYL